MRTQCAAVMLAVACFIPVHDAGASLPATSPVLVELFTSEGCSSCPPADMLLEKLDTANNPAAPPVIVLSEHVDYWNSLGWKDPWSSAAFSARQNGYAQRFHLDSVYTPQMVVNGAAEFSGSDAAAAKSKIASAAAQSTIPIVLTAVKPGTVRVDIDKAPAGMLSGSADVVVALAANETSSQVLRGENGGRKLHHVAVARSLNTVGEYREGQPFSKEISTSSASGDMRVVVWLQQRGQGRIVGSAMRLLRAN